MANSKNTPAKYPNILSGLDHFEPKDLDHHMVCNVAKMAMTDLRILETFLDRYVGERRRIRTIDEPDLFGRNALHWTVGFNHVGGYNKLVNLGADVNFVTDRDGLSPLMIACRKGGSARAAKFLLDNKADVSIKSRLSANAFHIATASATRDCMRLLIMCGADPFAPLKDGRTAVDLAKDEATKNLVYSCYRSATIREEKKEATCATCNVKDVKLDRCGKCYVVFYCCRKCQLDHWRSCHREECKGHWVGKVLRRSTSRAYSTKAKIEKTFVVSVEVPEESASDITFRNEERCLDAIVSVNSYDNVVEYLKKFDLPVLYFWAKYTDPTRHEIEIYYGAPLPIGRPDRYADAFTTSEEESDSS